MRAVRNLLAILALLGVGLLVEGCRQIEEEPAQVHQPAKVEEVAGLDVLQVSFDPVAAERVSLRTARVRDTDAGTVLPYAALIYDPQGRAWVYTNPAPLTFRRAEVVVDRIMGRRVWIHHGPPSGTRVVTVGATEVYGAELDVAGGH